ncbi:OLC1v1000648C1 [Oldenlandia corymbosa var. corymbosa]|uniref:OLC1v1000648C1 n=1 Tax=Oldenlandia corymbosa var. corymbosa TaxID=529605 RepID=A0AAV1D388_OLDCO|nr:OLC1v1000648C1 [Oldenlandia corymbosa var. corymbosa]
MDCLMNVGKKVALSDFQSVSDHYTSSTNSSSDKKYKNFAMHPSGSGATRVSQELISRMEAKEKALLEKEESSIRLEQKLVQQEKNLREMDMRKEEMGSILKELSVREEKLKELKEFIAGLVEKLGSVEKKVHEMLRKRARDLDEKEEELKALVDQI